MEIKRKTREYFENITKDELCNENLLIFLRAHSAELRGSKLGWFLNIAEQYTIGEFCKLTKQQVKKFRNIGNISVMLIEGVLKKYGLHLSQSEEQPQKETNVVESTKNLIIDWEQRRYEIAKELFVQGTSLYFTNKDYRAMINEDNFGDEDWDMNEVIWSDEASISIAIDAINNADVFIQMLKNKTNSD